MAVNASKAAQAAAQASQTSPEAQTVQAQAPVNRFMVKFPTFSFTLEANGGKEYPQQKDRSGKAVPGTEHLVQAAFAKVDLPLGDELSLEATIYRHDDKTANARELVFSFPKGFKVPKTGSAAIELERFKSHVLEAFDVQYEAWKAGAAPIAQTPAKSAQPRLIKTIS